MSYTTYVWRSDVAAADGSSLTGTLGVPEGATLVDVGAVVATPSSSGNVPITPSETARFVWIGPGNTESADPSIMPSSATAIARDVSAGEALWLTMTVLD